MVVVWCCVRTVPAGLPSPGASFHTWWVAPKGGLWGRGRGARPPATPLPPDPHPLSSGLLGEWGEGEGGGRMVGSMIHGMGRQFQPLQSSFGEGEGMGGEKGMGGGQHAI